MFKKKSCSENQNKHFVLSFFFLSKKRTVCEKM